MKPVDGSKRVIESVTQKAKSIQTKRSLHARNGNAAERTFHFSPRAADVLLADQEEAAGAVWAEVPDVGAGEVEQLPD